MQYVMPALFIVIAYLFGSISSAIILAKILKLPDPRSMGSRNPGATNMLRVGGKSVAVMTLLGDALKGFIPVLIAKVFGISGWELALVAMAAFIGHLYPVFFGFKGGKGVATYLGVLFALSWLLGVLAVATWLAMAFILRYSSLSALVMSVLTPFYCYFFADQGYVIILALMSIILILKHHENIRNLIAGTEGKLGSKKD